MHQPTITLRMPDGATLTCGSETVIGRARSAEVHVEDPRVSTVHGEISWRASGFVVMARGGRVLVDGRPRAESPLEVGHRLTLAPGVVLEVLAISAGEAPAIPSTLGRDRLTFTRTAAGVDVHVGGCPVPAIGIDGLPGALLGLLLGAREPMSWEAAAAAMWPEETALRRSRGALRTDRWTPIDERRYRNRWDQLLTALRSALAGVRNRPIVVVSRGSVALALDPHDRAPDWTP